MTAPEQMLKPCPFCGGEAKQGGYAISPDGYFCACQKCGVYVDGYTDTPEAITAWNTRPAPAELVEALTRFERRMTRATHNVGPAVKGDYVRVHKSDWHLLMDIAREARTALRNAGAAS